MAAPTLLLLACMLPLASCGVWTPVASLPFARSDMSSAVWNERVYLVGGCDGSQDCDAAAGVCACSSITANCVAFDPVANRYSPCPPAPTPRYRHSACTWRDGMYLIGGRALGTDALMTSVDVYNFTRRAWSSLAGSYPAQLGSDNTCVTLGDAIYVMGGYSADYSVAFNATFAFLPATASWVLKSGRMRTGRGDFTGVALNGIVYAYGGYTPADFCSPIASMEAYDPVRDVWTPRAPLPNNVAEKDDGVVVAGRIMATGGEKKARTVGCNDLDITPVRDVVSYDVSSNTWSNETALPDGRMRFASAAVRDVLYVFGGQGAVVDSAQIPILYTAYAYYINAVPGGDSGSGQPLFTASVLQGAVLGTFFGVIVIGGILSCVLCRGKRCAWSRMSPLTSSPPSAGVGHGEAGDSVSPADVPIAVNVARVEAEERAQLAAKQG